MLKYRNILEKLSDEKKTALVTDLSALSDPQIAALGVPSVQTAALSDLAAENGFPSYESMMCAWDGELIAQAAQLSAAQARSKGIRLFVTPDLKCAANDYARGLSEDALLNGEAGAAMARAVHAAGGAVALAQLSCGAEDVAYLDLDEDRRAVYDLFCKPFALAARGEACDAIVSALDRPCGGYLSTNVRLFSGIVSGDYGTDVFALSRRLAPDVDYHAFLGGNVCIGGDGVALSRALGRDKKLVREREAGSVSERELQGAEEDGIAIPPAAVDEAADRVLGFAYRVSKIVPASAASADGQTLGLRAARESIVLLKNSGVLPLKEGTRVAVIGDACGGLADAGLSVTARAAGYPREEATDDIPAEEAVRAAKAADVIVIFLHPTFDADKSVRALALPANLTELLRVLKRTGKRMIGVFPADLPADMAEDGALDAVLTAPLESKFCAAALGDVLTGRISPCGRLTRSRYDGADARYRALCADRDAGRTRIGAFVGYRYYDTAGMRVRYPFGYGLTYTKFVYSGLRIGENEVRFTVRNAGRREGCEVAQLYVGAPGFPMPKKELKGYARVTLAPGEAREVTIPLPRGALATYDEATHGESVAEGRYKICIGASVTDIRLQGVRAVAGDRPASDTRDAGAYFRDLSNIGQTYRLSAARGARASQRRRWLRIGALALLLGVLAAFVIAFTVIAATGQELGSHVTLLIVLAAMLAVCAAALIAENAVHRSVLRRANEGRRLAFDDPVLPATTAPEVFDSVFSAERAESGTFPLSDEPKYFDRDFTFAVICRQLSVFLAERGIVLAEGDLRSLLAAFACSRVLFFPPEAQEQVQALCAALSEYFGTKAYADTVDEEFRYDSYLYRRGRTDGLAQAVIDAGREPGAMFVLLCRHAHPDVMADLIFARAAEHVARLQGQAGNAFVVPPNLWIAVLSDQAPSAFPASVTDIASVLDVSVRTGREAAVRTAVRTPGYYQFANLCEAVRSAYPLEERLWKRIDRLEEWLAERAPVRIGNRAWIRMERFVSVCLACGGSETDALDRAVATQLLGSLLALAPVLSDGGTALLSAMEKIFGAEEIGTCRTMLARVNQKRKERGSV